MNAPEPRSVSRTYNLDALTAAGVGVPRETLRIADASARVASITVDNGSNALVGVFIDSDPGGAPSFTVAAGTYKTNPMTAAIVGIAFQAPSGDIPRGSCYVQCSDQSLSASSGISASAANATAIWDNSTYDTGAKMGG